jgi:hypothetical protein
MRQKFYHSCLAVRGCIDGSRLNDLVLHLHQFHHESIIEIFGYPLEIFYFHLNILLEAVSDSGCSRVQTVRTLEDGKCHSVVLGRVRDEIWGHHQVIVSP